MRTALLPLAYRDDEYLKHNPDLAQVPRESLRNHYENFGIREGRRSHALANRQEFAGCALAYGMALEIGPFASPLLHGPNARYADVLTKVQLIERAREERLPTSAIPDIDYVVEPRGLTSIQDRFDAILSSHVVEHQPDLVFHLQEVQALLNTGGRYFVLIPDHRYCFDHYLAPSTGAAIIQAHYDKRKIHTLASLIEHRCLTTHNDAPRHWDGDSGPNTVLAPRATPAAALKEYEQSKGTYIDVHAWYFTPETFRANLELLHSEGYTELHLERLYPTLHGQNEFWAVLRKGTSNDLEPASRGGRWLSRLRGGKPHRPR